MSSKDLRQFSELEIEADPGWERVAGRVRFGTLMREPISDSSNLVSQAPTLGTQASGLLALELCP